MKKNVKRSGVSYVEEGQNVEPKANLVYIFSVIQNDRDSTCDWITAAKEDESGGRGDGGDGLGA
ncbi:MAG: hypothetical protein ABI042_06740 [Verrucomicrobiota bacterium]